MTAHASPLSATRVVLALLAAGSLLTALVLAAAPASAFHGEAGDVIHKEIVAVNGEPVDDPDPETGAQNVMVTTGDEVTYRIRVSAGEEGALSDVRIEDVYKPPQQEFVGSTDLEGAAIECDLDIGTDDNTVGCDITLDEEGDGGVLLTFEVIQEAPEGEGCSQITNIATVTFAEELEPRPSNEARIEVCAAAVEGGQVTVIKSVELLPGEPESAFPLPGVGFTLLDAECDAVVAEEAFTDDAGVVVFADMEVGAYCLVETTPLEGFREVDPIQVEITEAQPSVEVEVLNEFAFNTILLKLDCTGVDEAQLLVFDATSEEPDLDLEACQPGEATFSLSGTGLDAPMVVDVVELELLDLAPGDYEISETAPNEVGPVSFAVGPDDLLLVLGVNPVAEAPAPTATPAPALPDTSTAASGDPSTPALLAWGLLGIAGLAAAARLQLAGRGR